MPVAVTPSLDVGQKEGVVGYGKGKHFMGCKLFHLSRDVDEIERRTKGLIWQPPHGRYFQCLSFVPGEQGRQALRSTYVGYREPGEDREQVQSAARQGGQL